jgi:hypothetical protein
MYNKFDNLTIAFDTLLEKFKTYIKQNSFVICSLIFIAVCAFGFELFNFNLTIDEEVHATYSGAVIDWVSQGRWGMYFLNATLFPHSTIPFVPLFIALIFHVCAVLLLLEAWGVSSYPERIIAGAVCVTFPIISYMYTFSSINYGVGAGLFCVALSVFLYSKFNGKLRFLAVIPAAFSVGIYQGFIPALVAAFLVYILLSWIRSGLPKITDLFKIAAIHILAIAAYVFIQKTILISGVIQETDYVSQYIDIEAIRQNFGAILFRIWRTMLLVYSGDPSLYGIRISYLKFFMWFLFLGFIVQILRSKFSLINKTFIAFLGLSLLLLPFLSGIILQGYLAMRFLVALPVVMMGVTVLGLGNNSRFYRILAALLIAYCVFQFIVSTNYLFGSSHLALQADRVLASQLIERIELEKADTGISDVKYLEVVGYYSRPSTPLMPKTETFGASFFEWDQGNPRRIVLFLQTLGYFGLQAAPSDKRIQMIEYADSMPLWPEKGSIQIIDEVVLVKFGSYSSTQKRNICYSIEKQELIKYPKFCK